MTTTGEYFEEQKFTQKWMVFVQYILLLFFLAISLVVIITKQAGPLPGALPFFIACVIVLLFKTIKLQTKITNEGIYYRFFPIHSRYRIIKKSDIIEISIKTYDPLSDYGGWGIRFGRQGKAFTIKGNKGIFIRMNTQKSILIGTCKPEEAERFLQENQFWI